MSFGRGDCVWKWWFRNSGIGNGGGAMGTEIQVEGWKKETEGLEEFKDSGRPNVDCGIWN